jgi:hypothetical protein
LADQVALAGAVDLDLFHGNIDHLRPVNDWDNEAAV